MICPCTQVAPQLQVIVCGEEPLKLNRVSTAEVQLPPLPEDAAFQLLVAAAPKVRMPPRRNPPVSDPGGRRPRRGQSGCLPHGQPPHGAL